MKKFVCLLTLVMAMALALSFAGCAQEPLAAEFGDNINDAVCFYKEEFDLEPYVKKQEGVNYYVTAEQIDSETLDALELEVNGFKFTPTLNEEVLVSFVAERNGERVTSKEITIFLEVHAEQITLELITTWCDAGFSKSMNLDEQYIKSGGRTSLAVKWYGKEASDKDRFQYFNTMLGNDVTECFSVTDWSDAVLTFWVYNPTDEELEIAPIWSHNDWMYYVYGEDQTQDKNISLYHDPRTITVAQPNAWTEIKYSLRYYGMLHNFYYDDEEYYSYETQVSYGTGFDTVINKFRMNQNWWTCRWGGRERAGKYYAYEFYVDCFDIRNYDAQKDADLDHEYRGFWNQPIAAGSSADVPVANNDGNTLTFKYKIVSGEKFGVALIEDDMSSNYFGYYMFNAEGAIDQYSGVTVTDDEDGYKTVVMDLSLLNVLEPRSTTRPQIIKKIFLRDIYTGADVIIKDAK